jgi:hypothetical protein
MTYLITWLTILFGLFVYHAARRDGEALFAAAFWSAFALLMHAFAFG